MQPLFVSTGALFNNRRVMGKPYTLQVSTDAFFERKTGDYEGYNVTVYGARPFYTMNDRFSYGVSVSRGQGVVRQEQMGSRIYWDDAETDETESIPRSWAYTSYALSAFGDVQYRYSTVFRLGGGLSVSNYEVEAINSESLNAVSDESRERFISEVLPESLLLAYPHIRASFYRDRFSVFKNLSSFALSEELQLGFSGSIYGQFPTQALGSTQDLVIAGGYLVFREKLFKDALLEFAVSGRSSYRSALERWADSTFLLRVRGATSSHPWGRIVTRADWVGQREQITADPLSLGGDNGLRGYPSQHFLSFGGIESEPMSNIGQSQVDLGHFMVVLLHSMMRALYTVVPTNRDMFRR